jgi:hypothetical protein
MTKIAGSGSESGSISQRQGSRDPDLNPQENVMDPEHWVTIYSMTYGSLDLGGGGRSAPFIIN